MSVDGGRGTSAGPTGVGVHIVIFRATFRAHRSLPHGESPTSSLLRPRGAPRGVCMTTCNLGDVDGRIMSIWEMEEVFEFGSVRKES